MERPSDGDVRVEFEAALEANVKPSEYEML
jgi:hypothetical protein